MTNKLALKTMIIDRIEGETVVVEVDGNKMKDIPKSFIFGSFKEGDILVEEENGKLKVDEELTKQRREEIRNKFHKLFK